MPKITYKQFIQNNPDLAPKDEVTKTVGTPSVSGAAQPSKPAPSVEYSPNKLGEGDIKTVTDGTTSAQYSANTDPVLRHIRGINGPETPTFTKPEKEHYAPCINPSCKSYGKSHPNCLCYAGPGGSSLENSFFAHGGIVCAGSHKEGCEHFADGGAIKENEEFHYNPVKALDHAVVSHGLLGLLTKTGKSKDKHVHEHHHHSKKGHREIHNHMEEMFMSQGRMEPDRESREGLKNHLQSLREDPSKMLEVGGSLGNHLPEHGIHLAAKTGAATEYLNSLKPPRVQQSPLDTLAPVDKIAQGHYDRHIDIAQKPQLIMQHFKDGTLRPDDLTTLHTLYPELGKSMQSKAYEALINAKNKGIEIPYKQKQSLSLLIGQPLDSTMTPISMQAIINANGPGQAQAQQAPPKSKKATGVELKQINKVNAMDTTILQDREMDRRK